jgi:hypothetical protein
MAVLAHGQARARRSQSPAGAAGAFHRVLVRCSTCEMPWQYVVLPLPGAPITSCPKPIGTFFSLKHQCSA